MSSIDRPFNDALLAVGITTLVFAFAYALPSYFEGDGENYTIGGNYGLAIGDGGFAQDGGVVGLGEVDAQGDPAFAAEPGEAAGDLLGYDPLYVRSVDRFLVPSRFYLDKFVEWGFPAERFEYVPNFVSADSLEACYAPGARFVFFGRLSREKGIATLIRAATAAKVMPMIVSARETVPELLWRGTLGVRSRRLERIHHMMVVAEPVDQPQEREYYLQMMNALQSGTLEMTYPSTSPATSIATSWPEREPWAWSRPPGPTGGARSSPGPASASRSARPRR